MPQLNPALFLPQIFWLAIIFGLLYLVMTFVALPQVASVLEERRKRIASDLDRAADHKAQADQAVAAYEQGLAEARARAEALAREARERLNAEAEERRKGLEAGLAERLAAAETRIRDLKAQAMGEVRTIAAEAAGAIVEQLTGDKPAQDAVQSALSDVMAA